MTETWLSASHSLARAERNRLERFGLIGVENLSCSQRLSYPPILPVPSLPIRLMCTPFRDAMLEPEQNSMHQE